MNDDTPVTEGRSGTFVTVGNATQRFDRLLEAVKFALLELPRPITVQSGNTPFTATGCRVVKFLNMDEFSSLISSSRLLIMHAGAGSIIQAIHAGHYPIVMPRLRKYREVVDDHQLEFSKELMATEKICLVHEPAELIWAVRKLRGAPDNSSTGERTSQPELLGAISKILQEYAN